MVANGEVSRLRRFAGAMGLDVARTQEKAAGDTVFSVYGSINTDKGMKHLVLEVKRAEAQAIGAAHDEIATLQSKHVENEQEWKRTSDSGSSEERAAERQRMNRAVAVLTCLVRDKRVLEFTAKNDRYMDGEIIEKSQARELGIRGSYIEIFRN